jgi:hypothetical protein
MAKEDKKSKKDKGAEKSKAEAPKSEKKGKPAEKEKKSKPAGDFTQKKFSGSIALTKLVHVVMKKKNKKGKEIKGLFIPIKENHLVEGKEGAVYMAVNVVTKSPQDDFGQNGFISQNGGKKWSEASDKEKEEYRNLPILGNIKDFEDSKGTSSNDTSGSKGEVDEDDDLPF